MYFTFHLREQREDGTVLLFPDIDCDCECAVYPDPDGGHSIEIHAVRMDALDDSGYPSNPPTQIDALTSPDPLIREIGRRVAAAAEASHDFISRAVDAADGIGRAA